MIGAVMGVIFIVMITMRLGRRVGVFPPRFWGWICRFVLLSFLMPAAFVGFPALALAIIPIAGPDFTLRRLLVPLGWPRLVYWTAKMLFPTELIHDSGLGAFYGALALAHRASPGPAADWIARQIDQARFPRGPGVVAAGLLSALRHDRARARSLFGFADSLPPRFIRADIRTVARDWLVADAAHRGDWHEVVRLGLRGWRSLRWSYCVARLGERFCVASRRSPDAILWLCWIVAPWRWATLPLLRRALHAPLVPPALASGAADLPHALANLMDVLAHTDAHDRLSLGLVLGEVEALLNGPTTRARVRQRLLDLGAPNEPARVLAGVTTRLVDRLVPLIEDCPRFGSLDQGGTILAAATEQVRSRWFTDIEAQCEDYLRRCATGTALGHRAEWEVWAALRRKADHLLVFAPASEETLFQTMYIPVNNFAVFQQNSLKRIMLAHAMYHWLEGHGRFDVSASQRLKRNIKASRS